MNERQSRNLNRKLLGGVVVVAGIAVAVVALSNSNVLLSIMPFLLVLACPLMMLFMMGSMGSMGHNHQRGLDGHQHSAPAETPNLAGLSREEQVRALRGELTRIAWGQEALRKDLEQLETGQAAEQQASVEHIGGRR